MIEVSHLKKSFGEHTVLDDISFRIEDKDVFGIIGKSGSGKTTLLDCLSGLQPFESGSIRIDGKEIAALDADEARMLRKEIGFVFQHFSLLSRRNVLENIALPMQCWKYDKNTIDTQSRQLAETVGLGEHIHKRPRALSGGQKQRVAIARALSLEPRYIVCDEFTSALDPSTTKSILALMEEIRRQQDVTILLVTHDMALAERMCNRMILLEEGKIVESGEPSAIFAGKSEALRRLTEGEA